MRLGKNVTISPKACIYTDDIEIGDNTRIDDFCILTGKIKMGRNVHLGCYGFLSGSSGIEIEDFASFSPRLTVFTVSDDYSGRSLTNPTIPEEYKYLIKGKVIIKKYTIIGCNTTVMPGVIIEEGCAIGTNSFVNKSLSEWGIYAGTPVRWIKNRSKNILEMEQIYRMAN